MTIPIYNVYWYDDILTVYLRADLTYYDAMEIMNILKRTVEDAESKTLFGGYKVKSLKDWDEIIKAFNSNNVYLADAAQILVQIALYEM